ncbi:MAG: hypothetical protein N3F66_09720 [Spirochaetes bacterium]|nr:hypothetical protein [Spirochaetota bacterium]
MLTFHCNDTAIIYNPEKNAVICIANPEGKKLWVKKLAEPVIIQNVLYDDRYYYLACRTGDTQGMFLTIARDSGSTVWFIPGRTFLEVLFNGFLYLIFVDEEDRYFLIKVKREDGTKLWHQQIDHDLYYYHFKENGILLHFASGKKEMITYSGERILY